MKLSDQFFCYSVWQWTGEACCEKSSDLFLLMWLSLPCTVFRCCQLKTVAESVLSKWENQNVLLSFTMLHVLWNITDICSPSRAKVALKKHTVQDVQKPSCFCDNILPPHCTLHTYKSSNPDLATWDKIPCLVQGSSHGTPIKSRCQLLGLCNTTRLSYSAFPVLKIHQNLVDSDSGHSLPEATVHLMLLPGFFWNTLVFHY